MSADFHWGEHSQDESWEETPGFKKGDMIFTTQETIDGTYYHFRINKENGEFIGFLLRGG
jgi:hypothetical protein